MPIIHRIIRQNGVAGAYALTAEVEYPGEGKSSVRFHSSSYGGPIVMETGSGQVFVSLALRDRIGHVLNLDWVRAFFEDRSN